MLHGLRGGREVDDYMELPAMLTVTVYGTPAPQGSKRHVGRGILVESSKAVRPWREAVKWAFLALGKPHVAGPVVVDMVFTLAKPQKPKYPWPATKPDIDKLIRSTNDALTEIGAIEDDSRIVRYGRLCKLYAGAEGALQSPGAVIWIRSMAEVERAA